MIKIALLFLTMADMYHEDYWQDFFRGHENQYSIYVHSKEGISDHSFFKSFELARTIPTTWANTMEAQVYMLKEALKNPDNQKFIFLSESTIPLQNFNTVYDTVTATDKSMFFFEKNPHQYPTNTLYEKRNLETVPKEFRYKNTQWVVLNRKHAQLMVRDKTYLRLVIKYESDQELYPGTFLASQGKLDEIEPRDLTYVNWDKKNRIGRTEPFVFSHLDDRDEFNCITEAIKDGFLFGRKFAQDADLSILDAYLSYRRK